MAGEKGMESLLQKASVPHNSRRENDTFIVSAKMTGQSRPRAGTMEPMAMKRRVLPICSINHSLSNHSHSLQSFHSPPNFMQPCIHHLMKDEKHIIAPSSDICSKPILNNNNNFTLLISLLITNPNLTNNNK